MGVFLPSAFVYSNKNDDYPEYCQVVSDYNLRRCLFFKLVDGIGLGLAIIQRVFPPRFTVVLQWSIPLLTKNHYLGASYTSEKAG